MVSSFIGAVSLLFSMFPSSVQTLIFGVVAILLIVLVLKIIALVLDSIPFL